MYMYYHFCRGNCLLVLESTINIFVHRKEETPCVLAMGLLNPQMCIAWRTIHQRASLKRAASQVEGLGFTSCGHRIRTGTSEGQESKVLCNMKGGNWWETSWFCCTKGVMEACKCMFPLSQLPVDMMDNDAWRNCNTLMANCMEYLRTNRASGLSGSSLGLPWSWKWKWHDDFWLGWVGGSWHVRWSWWRCWWRRESS
jgi:hypothetical protein